MTNKLKIKFAKFERTLVMQVLEQKGDFKDTEHVRFDIFPECTSDKIYLRGSDSDYDLKIDPISFSSNSERDKYLSNVVNWITEEQFTGYAGAPTKVGGLCTVSNDKGKHCKTARVIAILPQEYTWRYIYEDKDAPKGWACATYALSIIERAEPKIEGDVYTWEEYV